jgi:ATP phosphoribosyltransferase
MLTIAIPSKGRLKENCNAWFEKRGLSGTDGRARAAIAPALSVLPTSK